MKLPLLLFVCLFFFTSISFGQSKGVITGEITDALQKPIEGAVVSLLNKDNNILKTVLTDSKGKFELQNIKPDTFILVATHVGFQKYTTGNIVLTTEHAAIILPGIALAVSAFKDLSEITVSGKVPFVETKIDRTVVNPDALISNAGTTALDVLEKSPGVMVDVTKYKLKGKQGVLVYIDDKPTYLSAADLANYLKSLPSSSLGLIEIMTNPPAKYDAAGNAGIINIKIKRVKTTGFSGGINTSYGQGTYARSNNSINLNYRVNKINLFGNFSYNINNNYQDLFIDRIYYKPSGALNSMFSQNTYIRMHNEGLNGKLGLDYYVNKKSTIGFVVTGFNNVYRNTTTNAAISSDENSMPQRFVNTVAPMKRRFNNGSVNLNYNLKLNEKGKELSFNADYIDYSSMQNQNLLSNNYFGNGTFDSRTNLVSNLPAGITIKTFKADFTAPQKNDQKFEAGIKTSFINTSNVANFFDETNNVLTPNYIFTNSFNYKENINAVYVNYSLGKKRFSVQAGLRFENTNITGYQFGNPTKKDSSFKRDYNSLFPTFYISYNADTAAKHIFGFSFGRRIDRPNYQSMNPFTYPLDMFTLYSGNPFLQPTYSYNFQLSHTYKNSITTTLQYSHVQNMISETIQQSNDTFYSRPGNIGRQESFGVSVNGSKQIKKWWTLQFYTELMHNIYKAKLYNQNLNNEGTYWYVAPTNQFIISKTWTAELAGTYQTSVAAGQFVIKPVWTVRVGASKKIMKTKGTLKLSISDIFFTNEPAGDIKAIANSKAGWHSHLDTRVVTLSFAYRFNKGKGLAARNTGGSDTEKSRVK